MTVDELAAREQELLNVVNRMVGTIEEKAAQLQQAGIFDAYLRVHQDYVRLLHDPQQGREALKRALFLQWYAVSEPSAFTGLWELDQAAEEGVVQELDRLLSRSAVKVRRIWYLWGYVPNSII